MKKLLIGLFMAIITTLNLGSSNISEDSFVAKQIQREIKIHEELNDFNIVKYFENPVEYNRISSKYTTHRFHPVFNIFKPHLGIDLAAPEGTTIKAVYDGKISYKGYIRGAGYLIEIQHNNIYKTSYLHLKDLNNNFQVGDEVRKGTIIGNVGRSGFSTGPHLDFRIWLYDVEIDPMSVMNFIEKQ